MNTFPASTKHVIMCYTTVQEMIQNADDAGATEVKFILDHRNLPTLSSCLVEPQSQHLLEHYHGPSLLAYNDAVFTENDWEGIKNLQRSGKADDPFKVGRFGIGFNSVYHITGKTIDTSTFRDMCMGLY